MIASTMKVKLFSLIIILGFALNSPAHAATGGKPRLGVHKLTSLMVYGEGIATLTINPMTKAAFKIKIRNPAVVRKTLKQDVYIHLVDATVRISRIEDLNYAEGVLMRFKPSESKIAPVYDSLLKRMPKSDSP